jgi:hypothetical protein
MFQFTQASRSDVPVGVAARTPGGDGLSLEEAVHGLLRIRVVRELGVELEVVREGRIERVPEEPPARLREVDVVQVTLAVAVLVKRIVVEVRILIPVAIDAHVLEIEQAAEVEREETVRRREFEAVPLGVGDVGPDGVALLRQVVGDGAVEVTETPIRLCLLILHLVRQALQLTVLVLGDDLAVLQDFQQTIRDVLLGILGQRPLGRDEHEQNREPEGKYPSHARSLQNESA